MTLRDKANWGLWLIFGLFVAVAGVGWWGNQQQVIIPGEQAQIIRRLLAQVCRFLERVAVQAVGKPRAERRRQHRRHRRRQDLCARSRFRHAHPHRRNRGHRAVSAPDGRQDTMIRKLLSGADGQVDPLHPAALAAMPVPVIWWP